jgi:hypothetical protein
MGEIIEEIADLYRSMTENDRRMLKEYTIFLLETEESERTEAAAASCSLRA